MKEKGRKQDWMLVALVLILTVFGLVVLYSASTWNGQVKFSDSAYYLKKQAFATALGLGAMVFFQGWTTNSLSGMPFMLICCPWCCRGLFLWRGVLIMVPEDGCLLDRCLFSRQNLQRLL